MRAVALRGGRAGFRCLLWVCLSGPLPAAVPGGGGAKGRLWVFLRRLLGSGLEGRSHLCCLLCRLGPARERAVEWASGDVSDAQ